MPTIENRECQIHGLTEFRLEGNIKAGKKYSYFQCIKCRYQAKVAARHKKKQKLVDQLGGQCVRCGYNRCLRALEFHHLDKSEKSFSISQEYSVTACLEELKKCILLCSNCHREIEEGLPWELVEK